MMRPWLRSHLLLALMLSLLLFLSAFWLPQGTPQSCELPWRPCLYVYSLSNEPKVASPVGEVKQEGLDENDALSKSKEDIIVHNDNGIVPLEECPGQNFQVSRLLAHLNSALELPTDVVLQPYLSSWDELIKFMESLGPLVSFFSNKVLEKLRLIRQLAEQDSAKHSLKHNISGPTNLLRGEKFPLLLNVTGSSHGYEQTAYHSVRSMLKTELQRGMVNFHTETSSGCRTLLRLHRSLHWLQLLLEKLGEGPNERGQLRHPGELCREAYYEALAPYHPWLIRQAAELVFTAMPERSVFLHLVCVESQEEAAPVMGKVIETLKEVHNRTQIALQERGMLELP